MKDSFIWSTLRESLTWEVHNWGIHFSFLHLAVNVRSFCGCRHIRCYWYSSDGKGTFGAVRTIVKYHIYV